MYGITTNSIYQREHTMHDVLCASTELCEKKDIKYKSGVKKGINHFGNNYAIIGYKSGHISLDSQISEIHNILFHNTYYQSLVYLIDAVRYIGDIGILVRMLDMDPIKFIELKNQLCTNEILNESWDSLYEEEFLEPLWRSHKTSTNGYIPIEAKVLTLQIIYRIIKFCLIKIQEEDVKKYYILYNSFKTLAYTIGWKMPISVNRTEEEILITNIIQLAFHDTPFQDKIVVKLVNKKDVNLPHDSVDISITSPVVMAALPDISLLVHFIKRDDGKISDFGKARNVFGLRKFLNTQMLPYLKGLKDNGCKQDDLQRTLSNIISNNNRQDGYRCILIDKNLQKYKPDTWYKEVLGDKFVKFIL